MSEALMSAVDRPSRLSEDETLRSVLANPASLRFVFQRVFHLRTGSVVGTELLVRGPRGLETPDQLFEAAARLGLRHALDMACFGQGLEEASHLRRPGILHINVEPSTVRLLDRALLLRRLQAVALEGLCLELPGEHAGLLPRLARRFDDLRDLGVRLSVDDVDPRTTPLGPICDMRPAVLKAHPALIEGLDGHREAHDALVELAKLGSRLGAVVVAKWLASKRHRRVLLEMGISRGQSRYFGAPLPVRQAWALGEMG